MLSNEDHSTSLAARSGRLCGERDPSPVFGCHRRLLHELNRGSLGCRRGFGGGGRKSAPPMRRSRQKIRRVKRGPYPFPPLAGSPRWSHACRRSTHIPAALRAVAHRSRREPGFAGLRRNPVYSGTRY